MHYLVCKCAAVPEFSPEAWRFFPAVKIDRFLPESGPFHPETTCKLLHDGKTLYGFFEVKDQFVKSTATEYNSSVYMDSCVEFFLEPLPGMGYFNFEANAGGTLHISHITDPTRLAVGFAEYRKIPRSESAGVEVYSSLPRVVDPEITEPVSWHLGFKIPFAFYENMLKRNITFPGMRCRGNFFKCAEHNSHPHWACWSMVPEFNFHLPEYFGNIVFE